MALPKNQQEDHLGLEILAAQFTGKLNSSALAAVNALTDSSTGTSGGDTVAAIANINLSTSNTYTDAAVNTAVNAAILSIKNDIATLAAKLNVVINALK